MSARKRILVVAASGENIDDKVLAKVGTDTSRLVVQDIGHLDSFAGIRYGSNGFDNRRLTEELTEVISKRVSEEGNIGAVLLECSDLPPYAKSIQAATGLPVYDFNTMIDLIYHSVVQKTYLGYL